MDKSVIKSVVEKQMNTKVKQIRAVGKGASGSVYLVRITTEPYQIAVKTSKFYEAICKERAMLDFSFSKSFIQSAENIFFTSGKRNSVSWNGLHKRHEW